MASICDISNSNLSSLLVKYEPTKSTIKILADAPDAKPLATILSKYEASALEVRQDITFNRVFPKAQNVPVTNIIPSNSINILFDTPTISNDREAMYAKLLLYRNKIKFLTAQYSLLNEYFKVVLTSLSPGQQQEFMASVGIDNLQETEEEPDEEEPEPGEPPELTKIKKTPIYKFFFKNDIIKLSEESNFYLSLLRNGGVPTI